MPGEWNVELIAFIFGALLILTALCGGGIELKGMLKLPKIQGAVRLFTLVFGLFFVGLGIFIELGGPGIMTVQPEPAAPGSLAPQARPSPAVADPAPPAPASAPVSRPALPEPAGPETLPVEDHREAASRLRQVDILEFTRAYYDDLDRRNVEAAISKWKHPQRRQLRALIEPIEWFRVNELRILGHDADFAEVWVDVVGKARGQRQERWVGTLRLENVQGEWKILGMKLQRG